MSMPHKFMRVRSVELAYHSEDTPTINCVAAGADEEEHLVVEITLNRDQDLPRRSLDTLATYSLVRAYELLGKLIEARQGTLPLIDLQEMTPTYEGGNRVGFREV